MMNWYGSKSHGRLGILMPVLLAMLWGTPAEAFQFSLGEVQGKFRQHPLLRPELAGGGSMTSDHRPC